MTALLGHDFDLSKPVRGETRSCVICVGSTGTGKSSTISKVTGRTVAAGNGKDRVTFR
jgi:predicted GTPase